MTTRDKGITLPAPYPFSDNLSPLGLRTTDVANDYTSKNAWRYRPAIIQPVNTFPIGLEQPANFVFRGQDANASFAAFGGFIYIQPGIGSGGNPSGNVVIEDTAGNGSRWNTAHLQLNDYHLWVDTNNRLRIKGSTPGSAVDGNPVGWDLQGQTTYDPPNLADGAGVTTTVAVAGAALGDFAFVSFTLDLQGILVTAYVSAANTVAVRFQNETTGAIDLGSGLLSARVVKL